MNILIFSSLRVALASLVVCVMGYGLLILGVAQTVTPFTANGSLLRDHGGVVAGSRQMAQRFTRPGYFWSRPSAVDYDGGGAGGSNLAPTNPALAERARPLINELGAEASRPVPADLVTASGSGLDPHITEAAARYQVERVAEARGLAPDRVAALVERLAFSSGGPLTEGRIVNVLELNLALDAQAAPAKTEEP